MAKTYKCPYCNEKFIRDELVTHIEENNEELLPRDTSPFHMVFDIVNNKKPVGCSHGTCVVCKRDTDWNENNAKYARLCGRPQCNEKLRAAYSKNMIKVHGTDNLLKDAEQQEKMLANRKISGKYKFADGGYHTYTGSYEEKALEFEDKVLGFKSTEILSPGPTIEYEYKGETHKYITDQLIIPFNLIVEVKDGGGNTNGRINDDSRDRTLAKELAITNMGKYNYLRLTNNDFGQLMYTLAEIKEKMLDDSEDNKKVVININEEVEALKEMIGLKDSDIYYIREGDEDKMKFDEKVYFSDPEVMYEHVLKDSNEAGEDLAKLDAFCEKYKEYISEYEEYCLAKQKEFEKLTTQEQDAVQEAMLLNEEELKAINNMTEEEFEKYINRSYRSIDAKINSTIIGTANRCRMLHGRPWVGETQEEFDEWMREEYDE